ncbi:MAG: O-antigen ligase family protein, partial [Bacteroidota bacterium]
MQPFLQSYKIQAVILLFVWLVSMVLSAEFVLSVSMIGLLLLALFQLHIEGPKIHFTLRATLRENLKKLTTYPAWLVVSIPFLLVLISAIWSSDLEYTLERLRIKLPFLVLPFAFASMPGLRKREILAIFYFLLVMMSIISLYVCAQFTVNFGEIMAELGRGGHLPTPSNHIRFSLTLAIAILGGVAVWAEKFYFRHPFERWLTGGLTVFLFIFIHILSVRSGILALYLALFVLALHTVFARKKYLLGLGVILTLAVLPILAYHTLPSFQRKIEYARWDFLQYLQGKGSEYPDAERLVSMEVGLKIGNANPIFGVGAGDVKQETKEYYQENLAGRYDFKLPHNQLVTIYAGTGAAGLALFLTGFFYPLFYQRNYRQPLFLALHGIVFMSFLMENTIENNFGVSMYLFFLLIG